jgi:cystathionine beta-lyase
MAPSKTFNVPGLRCSFAIVPDAVLRGRLAEDTRDFSEVNNMGLVAALAAYRDGQEWLDQALAYLHANRDFVVNYVRRELPGIEMAAPEATYLAWMDCRRTGIPGTPQAFFPSVPASPCTMARGSARVATGSCGSTSRARARRSWKR